MSRITGIHPFKGRSYNDTLDKNHKCNIDFSLIPQDFPAALTLLCKRMLVRNPDFRNLAQDHLNETLLFDKTLDEGSQVLSVRLQLKRSQYFFVNIQNPNPKIPERHFAR